MHEARILWLGLSVACAACATEHEDLGVGGLEAALGDETHMRPRWPVGTGELTRPVPGPLPRELCRLGGGAPFKLVKNWDFGRHDNLRDQQELNEEFQYHDQWGTIANGTNYGAVIAAPSEDLAVSAPDLHLPDDAQPLEDPARPLRMLTQHALRTFVRPLQRDQLTVTAEQHDAACGSLAAKWHLPTGGSLLGHDILWETRARIARPLPGYWFALWATGTAWDEGPELDVMESFGTPNIDVDAFHSDAVGGTGIRDFASWPEGLDDAGVSPHDRDLRRFHTWSLLYRRDDSYEIFYDGVSVQAGLIRWSPGGIEGMKPPTDLWFLFDLGWGHTGVDQVNISLPAEDFPVVYEVDYSRVYMR